MTLRLPPSLIAMRRQACFVCPAQCLAYRSETLDFADPTSVCPSDRWPDRPSVLGWTAAESTMPSLGAMALSAGKAALAEAAAVISRAPAVSDEEAARRHAICKSNTCGKYSADEDRCRACGCYLAAKSRWRSQSCPKGLW